MDTRQSNNMATTGQPDKFQQPGWRIEQKYRPGVLIGNWSEQRYEFERQGTTSDSTHRTDFQHPGLVEPECSTRRRMALANEGLAKDHLFSHHGKRYTQNCISLYDQEFNHRRHRSAPRSWDWHRLAWLPEVSDHPVTGEGTKWGLEKTLKEKWSRQSKQAQVSDLISLYTLHYSRHSPASPGKRFASPRKLSSHLHPSNTNKDLQLRDQPHTTTVKPEHQTQSPSSSNPDTLSAGGGRNQLNTTI